MKWMKHPVNQDPKLSEIPELLGVKEYGHFWLLAEAVAAQIETKDDVNFVKYPLKKWSTLLKSQHISTLRCFKSLRSLDMIWLDFHLSGGEFVENASSKELERLIERFKKNSDLGKISVGVKVLNFSKYLDNRATSSRHRRPTGDPRLDENREDTDSIRKEEELIKDKEIKIDSEKTNSKFVLKRIFEEDEFIGKNVFDIKIDNWDRYSSNSFNAQDQLGKWGTERDLPSIISELKTWPDIWLLLFLENYKTSKYSSAANLKERIWDSFYSAYWDKSQNPCCPPFKGQHLKESVGEVPMILGKYEQFYQ